MKQILICLWLLFITFLGYTQTIIKGTVSDAITREALPGVTITINDGRVTATQFTDAKGKFDIAITATTVNIKFDMVGYNSLLIDNIAVIKKNQLTVNLQHSGIDLQPVIVSANRERQARDRKSVV